MIDLHMHSTASDGKLSPKEMVDLALRTNLKAIALTDHDSVSGIDEATKAANGKSLEIVPGIEINCDGTKQGITEVEVVGLFVNHKHRAMTEFVEEAEKQRIEQKKKILKKLKQLGFEISFEELRSVAKGALGRPHIAQLLIKRYPNEFSTIREVFEKYLGVAKPAYVDRENKYSIKQAVSLIKKCNGLSFLAHPGIFSKEKSVSLIESFQKMGGQGIETYYPYHIICQNQKISEKENLQKIEFYRGIAKSLSLLESGGSDFHGGDRETINAVKIPDSVLDRLKQARLI